MMNSVTRYQRLLVLSRWCSWLPLLTGVFAMASWLLSGGSLDDVGAFYLIGMLAVGMGLLGLPVSFSLLIRARKIGAPGALLTRFTAFLGLTLLVAAFFWWLGGVLAELQVIRVINLSGETIESVELWCEPKRSLKHSRTLLRLQPNETRLWALRYDNEGCATFRWPSRGGVIVPTSEERVFLGIGQPTVVTISLKEQGKYSIESHVAPRWMWIDALKSFWSEKSRTSSCVEDQPSTLPPA